MYTIEQTPVGRLFQNVRPAWGGIVNEDTTELCRLASTELDRDKLLKLLSQITESLDQEHSQMTPNEDDISALVTSA
jgi:hypothetical protein